MAATNSGSAEKVILFVSKKRKNSNRLHTNPNYNVVRNSINITYGKFFLWLYTNPNFNVVQDSIKNTF